MSRGYLEGVWKIYEESMQGIKMGSSQYKDGVSTVAISTGQLRTGQDRKSQIKTGQVKLGQSGQGNQGWSS